MRPLPSSPAAVIPLSLPGVQREREAKATEGSVSHWCLCELVSGKPERYFLRLLEAVPAGFSLCNSRDEGSVVLNVCKPSFCWSSSGGLGHLVMRICLRKSGRTGYTNTFPWPATSGVSVAVSARRQRPVPRVTRVAQSDRNPSEEYRNPPHWLRVRRDACHPPWKGQGSHATETSWQIPSSLSLTPLLWSQTATGFLTACMADHSRTRLFAAQLMMLAIEYPVDSKYLPRMIYLNLWKEGFGVRWKWI